MLQPKRFHLGWFVNFTVNAWHEPWADNNGPDWTGGFYVDMTRALERACFDYMLLEDTCMVSDAYGGSFGTSLKHAVFAPKHDPMPLVPLIAQATSRLGVVGTMSTSFYWSHSRALQRRVLARTAYTHAHFRDNLLEF